MQEQTGIISKDKYSGDTIPEIFLKAILFVRKGENIRDGTVV